MVEDLAVLTNHLNQVLAEENEFLDALNLQAAAGLLARKRDAVAALQAQLASNDVTAEQDPVDVDDLRDSVQRLSELGEANRIALEQGLALQMRLIQAIACAVPRARAIEAPIYQPDGSQVPPRPPEAYAFLSRM